MTISHLDQRFGSIAVKKGYITAEQLVEAITVQIRENVEGHNHRLIGAILHEKGYITIDQINDVLKTMI
jgi:hypothetical protein